MQIAHQSYELTKPSGRCSNLMANWPPLKPKPSLFSENTKVAELED
jgi:hypothetical protein